MILSCFSALEKLTNISDTDNFLDSQEVNAAFKVPDKLTSKNNLYKTTTGENAFQKKIEKILMQYNLKWNILRCIKIFWKIKHFKSVNMQNLYKCNYPLYYSFSGVL